MKKYLPLIVLLGLMSFSCKKAATIDEATLPGYYTFTLNATADTPEAEIPEGITKTNYADDDVTFSWSTGDAISVLFHKGETHKFFTLTTSSGGSNTASFSGAIEEGYELGASDAEGGAAWALFPANDVHYWDVDNDLPVFNYPEVTDYTQSYFSANIPMWAVADASGNFSFRYLTGCYKFTFTDVPVSKLKLSVHSNGSAGYYLSGYSAIMGSGSDTYLDCYHNKVGSGSRDVAFIEDIDPVAKKAVFYVPFRSWNALTPILTLTDATTDSPLVTYTAKAALSSVSLGKVVVIPAKSLSGISVYTPAITIDGDMSDWASITAFPSTHTGRIREWKFKSDENFAYFYFSLRKNRVDGAKNLYIGLDTDNNSSTGSSYGDVPGCEGYIKVVPFTNSGEGSTPVPVEGYDANSKSYVGGVADSTGQVYVWDYDDGSSLSSNDSNIYIEMRIARSYLGVATGSTITIGCSYDWGVTGTQSVTFE